MCMFSVDAIWWIIIVCSWSSNPLFPSQVSAFIVTNTLVENTPTVTDVYVDAARNVLYFGAGYPAGEYLGRVALGQDCGTVPSLAQVVAGQKDNIGLLDGVGSAALFAQIHGIEGTSDGTTLYCADLGNYVIRKVSVSIAGGGDGAIFTVTTIAGSTSGFLDGVGRAAQLSPIGLALNAEESALYVGDYGNAAIRRINLSTMLVETLVQNSPTTPIGYGLTFLRLTPDGKFVIFADSGNERIAKVSSTMGSVTTITNIAGAFGQSGVLDGVDGSSARFYNPRGVAFSPDGSMLYVGSIYGNVIQAIRLDGTNAVVTIAGNGSVSGYSEAKSGRDYMFDPVATFNALQGIALWQQPTQAALPTAPPAWAVIAADCNNGVIRCVSGPGVTSPFPPQAFKVAASGTGSVRGVLSAGPSTDAYIHPITGALFTGGSLTTVIRYDLNNRTGAFIEPPVIVAGSTAGYADGAAVSALLDGVFGCAGDGGHMVYVAEFSANFCVRSINITSLEVKTVAGSRVSAIVDGVGTAASLEYPLGLAYHSVRHILYVGGQTTAIRKIDLTTRNVTTLRLSIVINCPLFLQLTPSYDALFVSNCQTHTVLAVDTTTDTLIRVVAGSMGAAGTVDGFGSSARFTQPEGIALVGVEYGWPCLYVHEEFPAYIREIRLRDQYVRTIPLIGLPVGFDIEGIVSYTNRTSGEFGLLLMNYHVSGNRMFFLPLGVVPPPTPSASTEQTASTTTSMGYSTVKLSPSLTGLRSLSQSMTRSKTATHSLSNFSSARSTTVSDSHSHSMTTSSSTTHSLTNNSSAVLSTSPTASPTTFVTATWSQTHQYSSTLITTTPSKTASSCQCSPELLRVSLTAPASVCPACRAAGVNDTIVVLGRSTDLFYFKSHQSVQLEAAPVARASLLQQPVAPLLITMLLNGSNCWYVGNVTTVGTPTAGTLIAAEKNAAGATLPQGNACSLSCN